MIKILYIDDEVALLELGKLFLEIPNDIQVQTASSAHEALSMLKECNYDAVISDYQMPIMDGIAFLKRLRADGNGIPFILFTGRGREEIVIEALNSGADFYEQKGGDPRSQFKELEHKVREAVRRRRAENALNKNEQRLRKAHQLGHTGCWEYDRHLAPGMIWASEEWLSIFGMNIPSGEIPVENVEACIPERERVRQALVDLLERGSRYDLEYVINPADGSPPRTINSIAELEKDSQGDPIKVVGLIKDITERKRTEEALRRDEARNRVLFELAQMSGLTSKDIAKRALESSIELTHSQIGNIAFLNEDETVLTMQHYSKEAMERCMVEDKPMAFKAGSTGLWAEAVRQRKTVITNDYNAPNPLKKGLPSGHVKLKRHMSVPVFDRGRIVAVAGVANKESDYTEQDATDIALLMDGMWRIIRKIQAEEALRESEEEYTRLIATIPDFVIRTDINGNITLVNDQILEISGYAREEVIGRSIFSFIAPEDVEKAVVNTRTMMSRKLLPEKYYLIMKDGRKVAFEVNGDVLRNSDGSRLGVVLIGRDILERDKLETRLKHLNRELVAIKECNRALVKALSEQELLDSICRIVCDMAGYRMAWIGMAENDEARSIRPVAWSGFDEEYVKSIRATWANDDRGLGPAGMAIKTGDMVFIQDLADDTRMSPWRESALKNGYRSCIAIPLMNKGAAFGVFMMYSGQTNGFTTAELDLLKEMAGDLAFGIVSLRAKWENEKVVTALNVNEARFRALFETNEDTTWAIDQETGRIIDVNPAATRMYGYTKEEFIGLDIREISAEPEKTWQALHPVVRSIPLRYHKRKDGTVIPVEISSSTFVIDGRTTVIGTARDISERLRGEESLREMNRKLNLLSSITRHDLNNQMMVLTGYLALLEKKKADPPFDEYLKKIMISAARISATVQFTKTYEDIGVKVPIWQDIGQLVATGTMEVSLHGIQVVNDISSGLEIFADPLIQKVFSNLIDNSVRYGDIITKIRFSVEEHAGKDMIICADDGVGIPAEMKERLFTRGFGKNHGLGLFLSREILAITGITISEEGGPGQGARFVMTLPPGGLRGPKN